LTKTYMEAGQLSGAQDFAFEALLDAPTKAIEPPPPFPWKSNCS
jgi:hypothetical protein